MRTSLVRLTFGLLAFGTLRPAQAQQASQRPAPAGATAPSAAGPVASPASPVTASAPDVVRLKGGGLLRGTIGEYLPGKQLTILLVTGEHRTIPASDIEFAGPASDTAAPTERTARPGAAANDSVQHVAKVNAPQATVAFQADEPNITFYVKTSAADYERICTAPCEATLPVGAYQMALSRDDGPVRHLSDAVQIGGSSTMKGEFQSRANLRLLGILLGVIGGAGGIALAATSVKDQVPCKYGGNVGLLCDHETDQLQLYGGIALAATSITGGLLMLTLLKDKALVGLSPALPVGDKPTDSRRDLPRSTRSILGLNGLTLQGRF